MEIGQEYLVQWLGEKDWVRLIFTGSDRGFYLFRDEVGKQVVARSTSIKYRRI